MGEFRDVLGWEGIPKFFFGVYMLEKDGGLMIVLIDCFPDCPARH